MNDLVSQSEMRQRLQDLTEQRSVSDLAIEWGIERTNIYSMRTGKTAVSAYVAMMMGYDKVAAFRKKDS